MEPSNYDLADSNEKEPAKRTTKLAKRHHAAKNVGVKIELDDLGNMGNWLNIWNIL